MIHRVLSRLIFTAGLFANFINALCQISLLYQKEVVVQDIEKQKGDKGTAVNQWCRRKCVGKHLSLQRY